MNTNIAIPQHRVFDLYPILLLLLLVLYNIRKPHLGQANRATGPRSLRAGAGVVDHDEILAVAATEREVPGREPEQIGRAHV